MNLFAIFLQARAKLELREEATGKDAEDVIEIVKFWYEKFTLMLYKLTFARLSSLRTSFFYIAHRQRKSRRNL